MLHKKDKPDNGKEQRNMKDFLSTPDITMHFDTDSNQYIFNSAGDEKVFTALMMSADFLVSKGFSSTDGLEISKSMSNQSFVDVFQNVFGSVDERVKSAMKIMSSADILANVLLSQDDMKCECRHITECTTNVSLKDLLTEGILSSRDSLLNDHAWQGNHLMSETSWNAPITFAPSEPNVSRWERMYAEKLLPKTVSTAAATNPVSSPSRQRRPKATDRSKQSKQSKRIYVEPTELDVLFGRGGRSNHHPGNKRYHEEKLRFQPRYKAADRVATTSISQEFVDAVHIWGGRFLKLEEGTKDKWYEVTKIEARKKASQALREVNTPEYRARKRSKYIK